MTQDKYEELCNLAQFGDEEGEIARELLEQFDYEDAQQKAHEVRTQQD